MRGLDVQPAYDDRVRCVAGSPLAVPPAQAARTEAELGDRPGDNRQRQRVEDVGQRGRRQPFRARRPPMRRGGDENRQRREAGQRRRPAAIGETLGADEVFGDRAQDQREGVDDQIEVADDDERVDERLASEVARGVRRDGDGEEGEDERDPDRRQAGAAPIRARRSLPRLWR